MTKHEVAIPRLIDADALMSRIEDSARNAGLHSEDYRKIKRFIATTPTIEAEPVRHGRWEDTPIGTIECSECGCGFNLVGLFTLYCPYCGAKMDGGAEV